MTEFEQSVMTLLGESWGEKLLPEFKEPYMASLMESLRRERAVYEVFPKSENVFRALQETSYDDVKVVVVGQDPYHTPGMATGLAFSVPEETLDPPPSLRNIFKALENDLGPPKDGYHSPDLTRWAKQGVLLLNTTLTVRKGEPESHYGLGWESFTRRIISMLGQQFRPLVFLLWGRHARGFKEVIDPYSHWILEAPHPVARGANLGFLECHHFSRTNELLDGQGDERIDWFARLDQLMKKAA